ncbi:MAE_28990/MAE_18760 family HEPN-like nuclease, partial [Clostridium perfringens]
IEKLQEKLEEDLSWRKKELINIKTLIEDETNNIDKNILIRSGIALLCAHWEGYIRYVANMYIVYICN